MTTTKKPWQDSIVAEIHAIRDHLAEQYGNDLTAYSTAAEAHCQALGFIIVENQHRIKQSETELIVTNHI
jgi:hypothetical protein